MQKTIYYSYTVHPSEIEGYSKFHFEGPGMSEFVPLPSDGALANYIRATLNFVYCKGKEYSNSVGWRI